MIKLGIALVAALSPSLLLLPSEVATAQDSRPAGEKKSSEDKLEKPKLPDSEDSADPALAEMAKFIESKKIDTEKKSWKTTLPKPPQVKFSPDKDYFWNLSTTKGVIQVRFMPDVAPMHVSSTIFLTRVGFYDELIFHRVITQFMAQGGCPVGRGTGGPGYQYDGEFDPKVKHDRPGLLSMAHRGPGTDGSQFFLTFVPTPHLDGKHTIFGEVVQGMDTLKELEKAGSRSGKTKEPLEILKATISVQDKPKKEDKKDEAR
jgi:cyclophilin family peptidyl-prolyl cis-trans isomerase